MSLVENLSAKTLGKIGERCRKRDTSIGNLQGHSPNRWSRSASEMDEISLEECSNGINGRTTTSRAINLTTNGNPIKVQLDKKTNSSLKLAKQKRDGLIHHKRELLAFKDFSSEVRALRDVEQFAHQAELMLDVTEVDISNIIELMINKVS